MRNIHSIVLHHTTGSPAETVDTIRQHHRTRGWRDIGYHFVITRASGSWKAEPGRPLAQPGAHAGRGFPGNTGSVGVAVCGSYVDALPQQEALDALLKLLQKLNREQGAAAPGGALRLFGHCDLNATACPGQALYNIIPRLDAAMRTGETWPQVLNAAALARPLGTDRVAARQYFRMHQIWAKNGR